MLLVAMATCSIKVRIISHVTQRTDRNGNIRNDFWGITPESKLARFSTLQDSAHLHNVVENVFLYFVGIKSYLYLMKMLSFTAPVVKSIFGIGSLHVKCCLNAS